MCFNKVLCEARDQFYVSKEDIWIVEALKSLVRLQSVAHTFNEGKDVIMQKMVLAEVKQLIVVKKLRTQF
jgi:hypothetical protein